MRRQSAFLTSHLVLCAIDIMQFGVATDRRASVVRSFRGVFEDAGAHIGYVISASPYQPGAQAAADLTNVKLFTWVEFQSEFEEQWFRIYLLPEVSSRLEALFSFCEPINSTVSHKLNHASPEQRERFSSLKVKYWNFAMSMLLFTPHASTLGVAPTVPLKRIDDLLLDGAQFPLEFFDANGWREWLKACLTFGEQAISELRASLA
jgi:hypothetical protein